MKSKKQNKDPESLPEGFDCWDRSDTELAWTHKKLANPKFRQQFIIDSLDEGLSRKFIKEMLQFFGYYI